MMGWYGMVVGWYCGGVVWYGGRVVGWYGCTVMQSCVCVCVMMSWFCSGIDLGHGTWIFRLSSPRRIQGYTT